MKMYAFLPLALSALLAPLVFATGVFATGKPSWPEAHELTDARRAEIESEVSDFLASYTTVIESKDTEAIHGLYVEDERFAWFTDGEKRYTSADDILEGLASMGEMTFSTQGSDVEVLPLTPGLAHARSAFETKILQGDAVVYEFSGVITWLIEEVEDGEWRVLTGHTSTPKERR